MKYIKTFDSYRADNHINEELFGGVFNFLKNMWVRALDDIKKLGEKPTMEELDNWIEKNSFNTNSPNYLFKSLMGEFKKKPDSTDQSCLDLISNILDPETGILGKTGLSGFYDNLLKAFGKNLAPLETIKYYFTTARNKAIKDYKYAGGPDGGKIDQKKIIKTLEDTTHLPEFKKVLIPIKNDPKKMKDATIAWVEKTLIPRLLKYIQEIKPEEVTAYLKSKNIVSDDGSGSDYKMGDTVIYLTNKGKGENFEENEWTKITDDEKKNTEEGKMKELVNSQVIGIKKISKIDGDKVSFVDANFTKKVEDILMKVEGGEVRSEEAKKAAEELGKIKDDPEKMTKVANYATLLQNDAEKAKVDQIEQIIGGGNEEAK